MRSDIGRSAALTVPVENLLPVEMFSESILGRAVSQAVGGAVMRNIHDRVVGAVSDSALWRARGFLDGWRVFEDEP